ncbi:MAG TPA: (d)CMP kinase, partial [Nitriliruptoraceae bacterium]|nr:(d)CMP kinase [Nitriliruptoraceae bacterium]
MSAVRVAIDGPSGSGKSTIAQALAERLGVPHLNTGAMYRAVAIACLDAGVDPTDEAACTEIAEQVLLEWDRSGDDARLMLDGIDITDRLRNPTVNDAVSAVSSHAGVRTALVDQQRLALADGGVAEGRDIAAVVIPDADLKVWLTADEDERIRRRA